MFIRNVRAGVVLPDGGAAVQLRKAELTLQGFDKSDICIYTFFDLLEVDEFVFAV